MDPDMLESHVLNHVHSGLIIKSAEDKGRGVFTNEDIKKGDILIVEKPLA